MECYSKRGVGIEERSVEHENFTSTAILALLPMVLPSEAVGSYRRRFD